MSVRFGKDGTLYCNTVRYNHKQERNMIADNSYGNISGTDVWSMYNVSASTSPVGYKSYRCFYFNASSSQASSLQQKLPILYTNHKYYISARVYSNTLKANGAIYIQDSSNNSIAAVSVNQTYSSWTLVSNTFTPTYNITGGRIYCIEYNNPVYINQFILVDLTNAFGSGNEPTKAWCDLHIREHEVYVNYGNVSNNVTYSNIETRYTGSALTRNAYTYLSMDNSFQPRDYMYKLTGSSSNNEGYLTSASSFTLTNTQTYYFQVETCSTSNWSYANGESCDLYFPIAEPSLGGVPIVYNQKFNGGGGMKEWKRISMYGIRTSFTSGSYQLRFDFNNKKSTHSLDVTAIALMTPTSSINQYNKYNGTSITLSNINKEWCDRWIDGRSSPIIHIKDHNNTSIKFNTDYDVVCNDIEIRPEVNSIKMTKTGTIICKKLVRAQSY